MSRSHRSIHRTWNAQGYAHVPRAGPLLPTQASSLEPDAVSHSGLSNVPKPGTDPTGRPPPEMTKPTAMRTSQATRILLAEREGSVPIIWTASLSGRKDH